MQSNFDVVVIGAGLSGSLVCNNLRARLPGLSICCVDKGPRAAEPLDEPSLAHVPVRAEGLGGTTNLWHNGLTMPTAGDRCPVHSSITKFIPEAVGQLSCGNVSPSVFHSESVRHRGDLQIQTIYYPPRSRFIPPSSISIRTNRNITNIEKESEGYLIVLRAGDFIEEIRCKKIVIAAGCFGTISLMSEILRIPVPSKYFDHPMGFIGKIKLRKKSPIRKLLKSQRVGGHTKNHGVVVEENGRSSIFYISPAASPKFNKEVEIYKSTLGTLQRNRLFREMLNIKLFHPDIVFAILSKFLPLNLWRLSKHFSVLAVFEQNLDNENSYLEQPVLRISEEEINDFNLQANKFLDLIRDEIESFDVPKISEESLWSAAHFSGPGLEGHLCETNQAELKEWPGVFISSSAAFSRHGHSNTGVSLAAQALHVSSLIEDSFSHEHNL